MHFDLRFEAIEEVSVIGSVPQGPAIYEQTSPTSSTNGKQNEQHQQTNVLFFESPNHSSKNIRFYGRKKNPATVPRPSTSRPAVETFEQIPKHKSFPTTTILDLGDSPLRLAPRGSRRPPAVFSRPNTPTPAALARHDIRFRRCLPEPTHRVDPVSPRVRREYPGRSAKKSRE